MPGMQEGTGATLVNAAPSGTEEEGAGRQKLADPNPLPIGRRPVNGICE